MEKLISNLKINVNKNLFLIDPTSSSLGKRIVAQSIDILNEVGFEKFTFRKLGVAIESPEASIYRYFRSKNQLLAYLVSWYWGYMEYKLVLSTININSAEERLKIAIELFTIVNKDKKMVEGIEINKLIKIIISESSKSYLTKDVIKSDKEGVYQNYKDFVGRIAKIILEINPDYKYPNMLLSTIIEGAHMQLFFAEHLPSLTNKQKTIDYVSKFYQSLALQSIKNIS